MASTPSTMLPLGTSMPDFTLTNAVDGQPVHLVILLLVPPNRYQAHIRTLAGIARVLNDPKLRRQLLAGNTAEEVLKILVQREEAAV